MAEPEPSQNTQQVRAIIYARDMLKAELTELRKQHTDALNNFEGTTHE